ALDDGRKERIEVDPGVLQRLEESGEDSTEQCGQRDDQIRRRQAGFGGQIHGARHPRRRAWMLEDDGRHERGSTMTRAQMVWGAMPHYSWHSSGYSPGVSKRAVDRAIWPGSSIRLMLAPLMNIPWTTSRLVTVKVTVEPAGTRISLGVKLQIAATIETSYRPGATWTTPGLSNGTVSATFVGTTRPSCVGRWMPAPKAVTVSAASMPTGSAMLG